MSSIVQSQAHTEEQDDGGDYLNSEAKKIGAANNLEHCESDTEENKNTDYEVSNEEDAHDCNNTKGKTYISDQLFWNNLKYEHYKYFDVNDEIKGTLFASHCTYMNV